MDMNEWLKDRDEAFSSMDEEKIKAYCKKYGVSISDDEETFWIGVHKVICSLYLNENSPITLEQYNKSYDWLTTNGYSPTIWDGGEE